MTLSRKLIDALVIAGFGWQLHTCQARCNSTEGEFFTPPSPSKPVLVPKKQPPNQQEDLLKNHSPVSEHPSSPSSSPNKPDKWFELYLSRLLTNFDD